MAIPNKDEIKGTWEQVKGAVKDKVGEATNDRDLEAEGEVQRAEGETQETWGKFKRGVSETVDAVGDAISNAGKNINRS
ncbi:MAG: CsbD family protein [Pyrinomonadaceae bacterium]|nr:CsbD family protein [Pyrinomonadaceae bacterium]